MEESLPKACVITRHTKSEGSGVQAVLRVDDSVVKDHLEASSGG